MNTYLSEQVPAIFATAAARDAAIPSPILGQAAYLTGTRQLTRHNGTTWVTEAIAGGCFASLKISTPDQSVANNTATKITLSEVLEDSHGFALGSSALTVPAGLGGLYLINGVIDWTTPGATATGIRQVGVRRAGADVILNRAAPVANQVLVHQASGLVRLAAADVLELWGFHTQGSALNSLSSAVYAPLLQLQRIGD